MYPSCSRKPSTGSLENGTKRSANTEREPVNSVAAGGVVQFIGSLQYHHTLKYVAAVVLPQAALGLLHGQHSYFDASG
jgi:hypothetical protein